MVMVVGSGIVHLLIPCRLCLQMSPDGAQMSICLVVARSFLVVLNYIIHWILCLILLIAFPCLHPILVFAVVILV